MLKNFWAFFELLIKIKGHSDNSDLFVLPVVGKAGAWSYYYYGVIFSNSDFGNN